MKTYKNFTFVKLTVAHGEMYINKKKTTILVIYNSKIKRYTDFIGNEIIPYTAKTHQIRSRQ